MRAFILTALVAVFTAAPLAAEESAALEFGGDSFLAGSSVAYDGQGTDDLFMAGSNVRGVSAIEGSAHLAGRKVTMKGPVGGDAYLAGMDVALDGAVMGDATLAGYDVRVGAVGGDLRIAGSFLNIAGPVAGYALIAGNEVRIDGVLEGDVSLAASAVEFAEGARIGGMLTVYEEEAGSLEIPPSVIPENRITRHDRSEWDDAAHHGRRNAWQAAFGGFAIGVIMLTAIAVLVAALVPQTLADIRRGILDRPFRHLGIGFVTQSALAGSAILFAMTLIGMPLSPAAVLIALLAGFAGYVVAVYSFGVGLLLAFGRAEPGSIGQRALAAGVGAVSTAVIALIPVLGWLFVLALTLTGVGAISLRLFGPKVSG